MEPVEPVDPVLPVPAEPDEAPVPAAPPAAPAAPPVPLPLDCANATAVAVAKTAKAVRLFKDPRIVLS